MEPQVTTHFTARAARRTGASTTVFGWSLDSLSGLVIEGAVMPGERFPRRTATNDPIDRDVQVYRYAKGGETEFARIGEILADDTNPGRKKAFDIRQVMTAVIDQDHVPLERWAGMRGAETGVVWDVHQGGYPVCLIGIPLNDELLRLMRFRVPK